MHKRREVRDDIALRLAAVPGITLLKGRVKPIAEDELPAVVVLTGSERAERYLDNFLDLHRLSVQVRIFVRSTDAVLDAVDDIAEQVTAILRQDETLDGLVQCFEYQGVTPDYESAADMEIAVGTMDFEARYFHELRGVVVDDLDTVHAAIDMSSPRNDPQEPVEPDGQIDAELLIDLAVVVPIAALHDGAYFHDGVIAYAA